MNLYSLFDRKMRQFSQPQCGMNDEVMARSLRDNLPKDSLPFLHPEDFDLYCIASLDMDSGAVVGNPAQLVCNLTVLIGPRAPGE